MHCNINKTGRTIRGTVGGTLLLLATAFLLWNPLHSPATYWIGGIIVAISIFMLIEATLGWCAIRAIGWKTPF